jgi:hypothetical protein
MQAQALSASDLPVRPVSFDLLADADPGLLPRLLAPFARRDLTPDRMKVRRMGEAMLVEIGVDAMPPEMLHLVEGNLRQVVGMRRVTVELRAAVRVA